MFFKVLFNFKLVLYSDCTINFIIIIRVRLSSLKPEPNNRRICMVCYPKSYRTAKICKVKNLVIKNSGGIRIPLGTTIQLLNPIRTHDPDQNPPQSYTAGPRQVQVSHHCSSGPDTGSNSGGRWIKKSSEGGGGQMAIL